MMTSAKLSSKYQITIPKNIRKSFNLKPGQKFTFFVRGSIIEIVPLQSINDAKGSFSDIEVSEHSRSINYRDRKERDFDY